MGYVFLNFNTMQMCAGFATESLFLYSRKQINIVIDLSIDDQNVCSAT